MLSPVNYERGCNEITSTLLDHKILVGEQRQKGLIEAKALWEKLYPSEPFEVDLTAPVNNAPDFKSRLEYDIAAACTRQRVFYYQVSLPHFEDKKFLTKAVERYTWHLMLKRDNPEMFLVPCYDFDLIWHAHQVNPLLYKKDTTEILGKVLKHDDSVNDRQPGSKLNMSEETTREKWKNLGQEFAVNGAMFRGEPHLETNTLAGPIDYTWLAALEYTVDLTKLEVEGLPKPKAYTIKIDVMNGERVLKRQIRGPNATLSESSNALSTFTFKTKNSSNLKVRVLML